MESNKEQEGAELKGKVHHRAQTLLARSHLQAVSVGGQLKAGDGIHICTCHICRHSAAFQAFR